MLVKEMHIELELVAKRIAAKTSLRIRKEEADWLLNSAQDEFMSSIRNPQNNIKGLGFQATKKRMEQVQTLITNIPLDFYVNDAETQYAFLPDDFEMHNSDTYTTKYNCNGITTVTGTSSLYYAVLPITNLGDLYLSYSIQELTAANVLVRNLATHTGVIGEADQKFEIVRELLYKLRQNSDLEVYWEKFSNIYSSNSFIFVKKSLGTITKIRATNGVANSDVSFTQLQFTTNTTVTGSTIKGVGRLTDESLIEDINNYTFTSTIPESPLSTIKDNKLFVYHDTTFFVDSGKLSYIRTPRPINVDLGWNCELPKGTHGDIVLIGAKLLCTYRGYKNVEGIVAQIGLKD